MRREVRPITLAPKLRLYQHNLPGRLIVFSGIDGSGKTTLIALTRAYLQKHGVPCKEITLLSRQCRALSYFRSYAADPLIAAQKNFDLVSLCVICFGDRLMTVRTRLIPTLRRGFWVLCDRYVYTAFAELAAIGCPAQDMAAMRALARLMPAPDLAVLADVSANEAVRRIKRRPNEHNRKTDGTHLERLVGSFRSLAAANSLAVVPTAQTAEEAFYDVRYRLDPVIEVWQNSSAQGTRKNRDAAIGPNGGTGLGLSRRKEMV